MTERHFKRIVTAPLALGMLVSVQTAQAQGPTGVPIDLSHDLDEGTIYWPTAEPFELTVESAGINERGWWYAANSFRAAEHGGTHLDAPIHFAEGARTADQIPLEDLMGPAVVIDVRNEANANRDYRLDVDRIARWEEEHGAIPDRAIVLIRTGWGERWPDAEAYLGTAERGPDAVPDLHFPGVSEEAARWLVERRSLKAIGIDTASIDFGQSVDFFAHRVLAEANIPIFENVARLDQIPAIGSWVIGLPMKIAGGTGGPVRLVGFVSDGAS